MIALTNKVSKCLFLLILIAILVACNPFSATRLNGDQSTNSNSDDHLILVSDQEIISRLDTYSSKISFSGSMLVARDGKVLLRKSFGKADREKNTKNTDKTKFRIASITKQFTAMAILMLQAQDKLDVNDSVCDYVSSCPLAWQTITLHHLLTHTSGIPDYYSSPNWASYQATPVTPAELIEQFIEKPLDFEPGKMWNYSNSGYDVLGIVIEQVSGTSYENFIKDNILDRLKMKDTGYLENIGDLAIGYPDAYTTQPANFEHPSTLFASGGLYSTVNDLYLWDQALFTDKLIPKDLLDEMFTPCISVPDMPRITVLGYGYGWFIGEIEIHRMAFHIGRIEGFTAFNSIYPDDKVVVIVLSNQRSDNVIEIGNQLANIVYGDQ